MKPIEALTTLFNKGMKAKVQRQKMAQEKVRAGGSGEEPAGEMSLLEHVFELRKHLVRSLLYLFGFSIIAIIFMEPLVRFLRRPFEMYQIERGRSPNLMSIGLFEVIMMNFKICFIVGLVAAVPFIIREVWRFVEPALYEHEQKLALPVVLSSMVLFYTGISFGFFVIVPAFLANTMDWAAPYADVHLTVDSYFSSLSMMVMIFGIIFEVPVLLSLLGLVGILKSSHLANNRRAVILGSFIVGAVVSPPDVMSQVIVSLPLYAMIEVSIVALRVIEHRRAKASVEAEASNDTTT